MEEFQQKPSEKTLPGGSEGRNNLSDGNNEKRVLCIVSWLGTGGAETFLMKVYRNLPREYKLDFVVSLRGGFYEEEVESLGGKVYFVPTRTKHFTKSFYDIVKIVRDNRYCTVLKLGNDATCVTDLFAAKVGGAKKICVRACNAIEGDCFMKKVCLNALKPLLDKIVDVRIAPSDVAADYMFGKRYVKKRNVTYLHNGLNLDEFCYSIEDRNTVREELGIGKKEFVVCHIGRFNYQKNHEFLIDIFAKLHGVDNNTVLLLVGNGELEEKIKNKVRDNQLEHSVRFLGIRNDVNRIMSASDALLFPSLFEGMPNVVIEAQAMGLPCYVSDTITKQAKITDLVSYISLNDSAEKWASTIVLEHYGSRFDTTNVLRKEKYDIETVTNDFVKTVF